MNPRRYRRRSYHALVIGLVLACGWPQIPEGEVNYRPSKTTKLLTANGREQPGNPLELEYKAFCLKCADEHDKSN